MFDNLAQSSNIRNRRSRRACKRGTGVCKINGVVIVVNCCYSIGCSTTNNNKNTVYFANTGMMTTTVMASSKSERFRWDESLKKADQAFKTLKATTSLCVLLYFCVVLHWPCFWLSLWLSSLSLLLLWLLFFLLLLLLLFVWWCSLHMCLVALFF